MTRLVMMLGVLCLAFLAVGARAQESVKEYLGEAQQSINAKNYDDAISKLERALSISTDTRTKTAIKNAIGWAYFSAGNTVDAKKYLQEAYKEATGHDFADIARRSANNLGLVAFSQENLKEAREYFTSKWAKDSETATLYLKLIDSKLKAEKVNGYISSGINYRLNRQFSEAIGEYDKALSLDPKNVRALEYKGYALFRLGQYDEALAALGKAHAVEPDRISVLLNMLKAACGAKKLDEARKLALDNREVIESNKKTFARDGEFNRVCGATFLSDIGVATQPTAGN